MEIWKNITGYEGLYQISNWGRVKRLAGIKCKKERLLTQHLSTAGYLKVGLYKNAKGKNIKIHRLLAVHFIPNPYLLPEINHKNCVKTDNSLDNLEWITHRNNALHAIENGIHDISGEKHFGAKLTQKTVLEIRNTYHNRKTNIIKFAASYGISRSTLLDIMANRRWKLV